MFAVFDIETNGLLNTMTRIHLLTIKEQGKDVIVYREDDMANGLRRLMSTEDDGYTIYGHNIIKFDIPAIQKLHPWFTLKNPQDTLVLSRLMYADMGERDGALLKSGALPPKLWGSHSLEAWGYRLGEMKGEYEGDTSILDLETRKATKWDSWNLDMEIYGAQDAVVTEALVLKLAPWDYAQEAVELEHAVATIVSRQERFGVCLDEEAAALLYAQLSGERQRLQDTLKQTVPGSWWADGPLFTPKRDNKKMGYCEGAQLQKIEWREFNPTSRQHIARHFKRAYKWEPNQFTDGGDPQIDESVLEKLDYPEAKTLAQMFTVEKRIGQLAEGTQAWLKQVTRLGRIHGSVNTNGAVTGRMTHGNPNLAQVPRVGTYLGKECRSLFKPPKGMRMVGVDASGLELRCLAHFMARWDDGAYANVVLHGDIHTANQQAAGLAERNQAKTFIYAFLYGAGPEKIGSIVGKGRAAGLALRNRFLKQTPAIAELSAAVQKKAAATKTLKGLDGRNLSVRSAHSSLNTLLQSAGALVMKKALVLLDGTLQSEGYTPGVDYEFLLNIHDEFQIAVKPEIADHVASTSVQSIQRAGQAFKFRCRLDGEAKVGDSWADTH
jgi:DNA polymerase I-like protein with 3'-5' exonuclease and polymerase domains